MASRLVTVPDLVSATGWRLLLAGSLAAALIHVMAVRQYATALVLAVALVLTLFDVWRLGRPRERRTESAPEPNRFDRAQLERANALLDAVTVALFVLDPDGRIRFTNRSGRTLAGFEAGRLGDVPSFGKGGAAAILAIPVGGSQLVSLADGRSMLAWVEAFAMPGAAPQRLVSMQAVTGELDAVQVGAWHKMARILAHEMMNSLTPIASLSESLAQILERSEARPDVAGAAGTIARRSRHLISFVERYRAVADLPEPKPTAIDLPTFAGDIERLIAGELQRRGIGFAVDAPDDPTPFRADAALLEQAVLNLLDNAADAVAGSADPRVRLSCERTPGLVAITVTDNGIGVPEIDLEEIFVPFFTTKAGGAGIGLPLARQVALAHGGRLLARRAGDRGMIFELSLPLDP
jgi:signal transduction histidine kinase